MALLPPPLGVNARRPRAGTLPEKGKHDARRNSVILTSNSLSDDEIAAARKQLQICDLPHSEYLCGEGDDEDPTTHWSFNEVLAALAALATPEVDLPKDLLGSDMMKELYEDGDDQMRKTLGEAMLKSREKNGPMGGMGDGLGDL